VSDGASDAWYEAEYLRNQKETRAEDSTWNDVIKDIRKREATGVLKYGKYLTPYTTEDTLNHLYEELLDAVVYIKTEIMKRKVRNELDSN
jgi:hypothetical protein